MSITAHVGPLISFGQGTSSDYNPQAGPSLFYNGAGILDPRTAYTYQPGEHAGAFIGGWLGFDNVCTLSIVPYTAAAGAVVASANPTSATLALVTANSSTTGVYVTPGIQRADTGVVDTGVLGAGLVTLDAYASFTATVAVGGILTVSANSAIPLTVGMVILATTGTISAGVLTSPVAGGMSPLQAGYTFITAMLTGQGGVGTYQLSNATLVATTGTVTAALPNPQACAVPFGQSPGIYLWNPQAMIGRALAVTAASGATYATATISGYDVYGQPVVEAITLTAGSQVAGKKAWKYVRSVVLSGGTADTTHAYSVDTTNVYGLPLRSDSFGDVIANYAASLTAVTMITAPTTYVASVQTAPSATTGDVRGTFGAFTASTGASKLVIRQTPPVTNVGSLTGLLGATQYANF